MKLKVRYSVLVALVMVIILCCALALASAASVRTDATIAISESLSAYAVGDVVSVKNDDYVSKPPRIITYYDYESHGAANPDYKGTQLVLYVVNTATERIGTKTDVEIIKGMLDRGYIVSVIDYFNRDDTTSPNVEWSIQNVRTDLLAGEYFTDKTKLPAGSYSDNYVVPAGYDVEPYLTFWEVDKHGAEGSLEEIVENWNTDLRKTNSDVIIPWVDSTGARKSTQAGFDGSQPVWYMDASGTRETASGQGTYTKLQYTKANDIYDCVGPDGEELSLSLYMHIVYPTETEEEPIGKVPILANANSSGHITTAVTSADIRPLTAAGLFNGYAGVIYDYLWFPMARSEYYGYYDGRIQASGGYTGDQMNYSLHLYNDKRINTAAMRFLKYLSLDDTDDYAFDCLDGEAIGVYGNSKGSWITSLGNPELKNYTSLDENLTTDELEELIDTRINSYISRREFPGHSGETRYQVGEENCLTKSGTKNGITIDEGERQPWLTYNGKELLGNAHCIYACCGPMVEDMVPGHAPMIASMNLKDNYDSAYASSNDRATLFKTLDIPSLYVISDVGHMYTFGPDQITGIDTFDAVMDFFGYYLKHDTVKVLYTTPLAGTDGINTDTEFTVKFTGPVSAEEIRKVTLKDSSGNVISGVWESSYGSTEWKLITAALKGSTEYILTIPEGICADNGKGSTAKYEARFFTNSENSTSAEVFETEIGTFFKGEYVGYNNISELFFRFHVANDAANVAELYAVSSFNSANPELSDIGELVGSVNLSGAGYYEIDVTEYVIDNFMPTETVTFLLKCKKQAGEFDNYTYAMGATELKVGKFIKKSFEKAPDGTDSLKVVVGTDNTYAKQDHIFYQYPVTLFENAKVVKDGAITVDDYGRKFVITISIYDTVTRLANIRLTNATSLNKETIDMDGSNYNFYTKANEWVDFSFEYTVYETDFGTLESKNLTKTLTVTLQPNGADESAAYIGALTSKEKVTAITLADDAGSFVYSIDEDNAYKAESSVYPFSIGDKNYGSLISALSDAASGEMIVMNSSYRLTASEKTTSVIELASSVTVDMNGYRIYLDNQASLFNAYANDTAGEYDLTFKNGSIAIKDAAMIKASGNAGSEDIFNLTFDNVYIYTAPGASLTDFILDTSSCSAAFSVNVSFRNSTVDIDTKRLTKNPVAVFSGANNTVSVSYTFEGGKIITDSFVRQTLVENYRKFTVKKDGKGAYTKLYTSASSFGLKDITVRTNEGYKSYKPSSIDSVSAVYELVENTYATDYGVIAQEYRNIEKFPVVIFDRTGDFSKGYDLLSGALNYFGTYSAGDEWFIYVRRDFTYTKKFDNLSSGNGIVNVDLGSHTITLAEDVMLYNADAKHPTAITVNTYNGKVLVKNTGAVRFLGWNTSNYSGDPIKSYDFNFEDVTFALAEGATTSNLVTYNYERTADKAAPATNAVTFTDCVFDITGATKKITLFTVGNYNSGKYLAGTYTVNGGEIIASDASRLDVYNLISGTESSIKFNKNASGEYVKFKLPASGSLPTDTFVSKEEGAMKLELVTESGSTGIYTLVKNDAVTDYGEIPLEYASVEDYPFIVLDKEGNFKGAAKSFTDGVAAIATAAGDGAIVYLRRDYNMSEAANAKGDDKFSHFNGTITIDLGKNTITMESGGGADALIRLEPVESGFESTLILKNGSIITGADPLVRFTAYGTRLPAEYGASDFDAATDIHKLRVVLEGLSITRGSSSPSEKLFVYTQSANPNEAVVADNKLVIKDCEINLGASTDALIPFSTAANFPLKIEFIGGNITASAISHISKFQALGNTKSSVVFGRGANGEYTTLTLPTGVSLTSALKGTYTDASDSTVSDLRFVAYKTVGSNNVYTMASLVTPYGEISSSYASLKDYPWVVFNASGECVYGTKLFTTDAAKKACEAGSGSVIYLRRDFNFDTDRQSGGAQSLSTLNGSITVDLGGHTVTMGGGGNADAFIRAEVFASGYTTSITLKNGKILTGQDPVVRFSAITDRMPAGYADNTDISLVHNFFVYLNGLDIGIDPDYAVDTSKTYYTVLYTMASTGVTVKTSNNNVIVENCTFDMGSPTAKRVLFASNVSIAANVTVKGNELIYSNASGKVNVEAMNRENGSYITFARDSAGNYLTVKNPKGEKATTGSFNVGGVPFILKKIESGAIYDVYTLTPSVLTSFTPQIGVTLYTDLIYNAYVPKDNVASIIFGGSDMLLSNLEIVNIDGVDCYKVSRAYNPYEALEDVILKVVLEIDATDYEGTFVISIFSYASEILGSEFSDEAKDLARNMLSYVRAAYNYFECESDRLEQIDSLLGEGYDSENAPDMSSSLTATAPEGTGFRGVTFYIGDAPAYRFYYSGDTVPEYTFKVGERVATALHNEEEKYLEIRVGADEMLLGITFGEYSYSIYSYYAWAQETDKSAEAAFVERLVKYCESARDYRNSISE